MKSGIKKYDELPAMVGDIDVNKLREEFRFHRTQSAKIRRTLQQVRDVWKEEKRSRVYVVNCKICGIELYRARKNNVQCYNCLRRKKR